MHAPPAVEPLPTQEVSEEEEQIEEQYVEKEELKAPVELIIEVKSPIIINESTLNAAEKKAETFNVLFWPIKYFFVLTFSLVYFR